MDQNKIAALVEENMKTIFSYALSRVSHREDAEDLAGDIILAILSSGPKIRDENAFFGYIWAIAANTYKKYLYKKSRVRYEELDEETAEETDFVQEILQTEQCNTLRRELALLSREYRECTLAYYFEGLSCGETATRLHISLEMVKYYLFKTRKILKEGISMEREFGTKSYQPAKFDFHAVFSGSANMAYQNLFDRKLPGNILLSAYYTPMTIRQLAIELGVASAYLEDEIALLEKYGLLTALPGGRYQAHLVIFTEEYINEFCRTAEQSFTADVGAILLEAAKKLPRLRELSFIGSGLEDNCLLWDLLFEMARQGWHLFSDGAKKAASKEDSAKQRLYSNLDGICYGSTCETPADYRYTAFNFAGYCLVKEGYAASFADYGILPKKSLYTSHADDITARLDAVISGQETAALPIVSRAQKSAILDILQEETAAFARLYEKLYGCALSIMRTHAPESVAQIIEPVMVTVIFFQTVGLLGACAAGSGVLEIPADGQVAGGFIYGTE